MIAAIRVRVLTTTLVLTRWFPGALARRVLAGARDDLVTDGTDRRVGLRHGRHPGVQPRTRLPRRVRRANDANRQTNTHAQWLNSLFFPGIEFLGIVAMAAVLWVGGQMLTHGSLTIGTLVSSVFLLNLVFQPLQELSDLYGQVQSAGAAMEKITTVLDTEAEIHDDPSRGSPTGSK